MNQRLPGHGRIYLVAGSSSVGKTTIATVLSTRFSLPALHVDDLVRASDDPVLRAACDRLDVSAMAPAVLCEALVAKGEALTPLLHTLIAERLEDGWRGIVEGEGIHPGLVLRWRDDRRVHCVFVIEEDERRLRDTLHGRALSGGILRDRSSDLTAKAARMDALYGRWLRRTAEETGLPWIPSQPFETLADRYCVVASLPAPTDR